MTFFPTLDRSLVKLVSLKDETNFLGGKGALQTKVSKLMYNTITDYNQIIIWNWKPTREIQIDLRSEV